MILWSGRKISPIILVLILLTGFAGSVEKTKAKIDMLRDVPSVGLYLRYVMYTSIDGVPVLPAKLLITHDGFNDSNNETIKTTLSVNYHLGWIAGTENGTIVENTTSRLLTEVKVPAGGLLEILYGIYFNQSLPNFTPWWIRTNNISLGSLIRAFNITLHVVSEEARFESQIGIIDIWRAKANQTEASVAYDVMLLYEKISGILVGGNLWIVWNNQEISYNETFYLIETNAFRAEESDESWIWIGAVILIVLIPFVLTLFRFARLRQLKGGLD